MPEVELNVDNLRNLFLQVLHETKRPERRVILEEMLADLNSFEARMQENVERVVGDWQVMLAEVLEAEATLAGLNAMPPVICGTVADIEKVEALMPIGRDVPIRTEPAPDGQGYVTVIGPFPIDYGHMALPRLQKYLARLEQVVTDIDAMLDPRGKYTDPERTRGKLRVVLAAKQALADERDRYKRELDQARADLLAAREENRQLRKGVRLQ